MPEQISIFSEPALDGKYIPYQEVLVTILRECFSDFSLDVEKHLLFRQAKNYCSVCLVDNSHLFAWIKIAGKDKCIEVKKPEMIHYGEGMAAEYPEECYDKKKRVYKLPTANAEDVNKYSESIQSLLFYHLINWGHDFGCCAAYVECSDALHCVRTDPPFMLSCGYHKNLRHGRVFYGKNRNYPEADGEKHYSGGGEQLHEQ
jgi:hypothetical protein